MMRMMYKIAFTFFVLIFPLLGLCQLTTSLEQRALELFCETYRGYEEVMNAKVVFNERTNVESSRIYDVAHCFGEINLLTYQEGDMPSLDSLDKLKFTSSHKGLSICGDLKKTAFCWNKKYVINVYQSRSYYDNKQIVEITLFHNATGQLVIFSALFEDTAIIDHCFESIVID